MIQLHDKQFVPFISAKELDFAVAEMARLVEADFADEIPVFIGVLNGAFMVISDFMKHYKSACEVSFVKLSSYEGTESTDDVKSLIGLNQDLAGRSVIVIEDIVDIRIPNKFIVGYGLDYDGLGRNLPEVYQVVNED